MRLVLFLLFFSVMFPVVSHANPLSDFQWKNRLIVVFTKDFTNDSYVVFGKEFSSADVQAQSNERDIVIVTVADRVAINFKNEEGVTVDPPTPLEMHRHFTPPERDFSVFLVGKDGEIKQSWKTAPSPDEVFAIIDAMPMRQREMLEQQGRQ